MSENAVILLVVVVGVMLLLSFWLGRNNVQQPKQQSIEGESCEDN